jgi:hypothetical protein
MVLPEHRHAKLWRVRHLAEIGLEFPGQYLEEGRLARSVGADDAVAIARHEFKVDILEQDALAKTELQFADIDQVNFLMMCKIP